MNAPSRSYDGCRVLSAVARALGTRRCPEIARFRPPQQEHWRRIAAAEIRDDLTSKRLPTAIQMAAAAADFNRQNRVQKQNALPRPAFERPRCWRTNPGRASANNSKIRASDRGRPLPAENARPSACPAVG